MSSRLAGMLTAYGIIGAWVIGALLSVRWAS